MFQTPTRVKRYKFHVFTNLKSGDKIIFAYLEAKECWH